MTKSKLAELIELGMKQSNVIEDHSFFLLPRRDGKYSACALGLALIGMYVNQGKTVEQASDDWRRFLNYDVGETITKFFSRIFKVSGGLIQAINMAHQSHKADAHKIASDLRSGKMKALPKSEQYV